MIYVSSARDNEDQQFLDQEVEFALRYFKTVAAKPHATYVCIEWVKNTHVLLEDRPLDAWGT